MSITMLRFMHCDIGFKQALGMLGIKICLANRVKRGLAEINSRVLPREKSNISAHYFHALSPYGRQKPAGNAEVSHCD